MAAMFAVVSSVLPIPGAQAAETPEFMKEVVVNDIPTDKASIALNDIYGLNEQMLSIYERSLGLYKDNFRKRQNLIMALFGPKGGRFILYRAGQPPVEAPSPPAVYRMAKSVGHCAMATYDLLAPYAGQGSDDKSWVAELKSYRTRVQSALNALDNADLKPADREVMRAALTKILAFHDKSIQNQNFSFAELQNFARGVEPQLTQLIEIATRAQVGHWFGVLDGWKKLLGPDWDKTYALSNAIYVARQNNILFTVLAQYMGQDAINDRLLLLETTDFTTTPDLMMDAFMRIISDRALGEVFFKNNRLMDYELLGGGGRKAIIAEAEKRGWKAILPPLVPFNSHAWPWKTDPTTGSGPATLEEIH